MMREIDEYFAGNEEPVKGYLLALRQHILNLDENISELWKYKMPFYAYCGKRFCYLWVDKKTNWPYLGIVDGRIFDQPQLTLGGRSRMKIMLLDPNKDIPLRTIDEVLKRVLKLYKKKKN